MFKSFIFLFFTTLLLFPISSEANKKDKKPLIFEKCYKWDLYRVDICPFPEEFQHLCDDCKYQGESKSLKNGNVVPDGQGAFVNIVPQNIIPINPNPEPEEEVQFFITVFSTLCIQEGTCNRVRQPPEPIIGVARPPEEDTPINTVFVPEESRGNFVPIIGIARPPLGGLRANTGGWATVQGTTTGQESTSSNNQRVVQVRIVNTLIPNETPEEVEQNQNMSRDDRLTRILISTAPGRTGRATYDESTNSHTWRGSPMLWRYGNQIIESTVNEEERLLTTRFRTAIGSQYEVGVRYQGADGSSFFVKHVMSLEDLEANKFPEPPASISGPYAILAKVLSEEIVYSDLKESVYDLDKRETIEVNSVSPVLERIAEEVKEIKDEKIKSEKVSEQLIKAAALSPSKETMKFELTENEKIAADIIKDAVILNFTGNFKKGVPHGEGTLQILNPKTRLAYGLNAGSIINLTGKFKDGKFLKINEMLFPYTGDKFIFDKGIKPYDSPITEGLLWGKCDGKCKKVRISLDNVNLGEDKFKNISALNGKTVAQNKIFKNNTPGVLAASYAPIEIQLKGSKGWLPVITSFNKKDTNINNFSLEGYNSFQSEKTININDSAKKTKANRELIIKLKSDKYAASIKKIYNSKKINNGKYKSEQEIDKEIKKISKKIKVSPLSIAEGALILNALDKDKLIKASSPRLIKYKSDEDSKFEEEGTKIDQLASNNSNGSHTLSLGPEERVEMNFSLNFNVDRKIQPRTEVGMEAGFSDRFFFGGEVEINAETYEPDRDSLRPPILEGSAAASLGGRSMRNDAKKSLVAIFSNPDIHSHPSIKPLFTVDEIQNMKPQIVEDFFIKAQLVTEQVAFDINSDNFQINKKASEATDINKKDSNDGGSSGGDDGW